MNIDKRAQVIERRFLRRRRAHLDACHAELGLSDRPYRVGLSLSGGGIRSATLSLGVLDSLSRQRLIHRFDYLSTVSGGGYTGAFYASLFTPPAARGAGEDAAWQSPAETLDPLSSKAGIDGVRHLRENGRYLSPGSGDALKLATIAVRGWVGVQLAIGVALVAAFLALNLLRAALIHWSEAHSFEVTLAQDHAMTLIWPVAWLQGYPVGGGWILSPVLPIVALLLAISAALGWAYWLTRYDTIPPLRIWRTFGPGTIGTVLVGAACLSWPRPEPYDLPTASALFYTFRAIGALAAGAVLFYALAQWRGHRQDRQAAGEEQDRRGRSGVGAEEEGRVRNILTNWTAATLKWAGALAALALVETISQTIYALYLQDNGWRDAVKVAAVVTAAIPVIRKIVGEVQKSGDFGGFLRRFGRSLSLLTALLIAFVIAVLWSTVAQYLAWRGGAIGGLPALIPLRPVWKPASLEMLTLAFIVVALLINTSIGFLNLSTFSAFYAGRLRRAYLGASNPDRHVNEALGVDQPGDDITLSQYYHGRQADAVSNGAPLHLINVTLNETHGASNPGLVQRDRKGRPLTISPAGYLVDDERETARRYQFRAEVFERRRAAGGAAAPNRVERAWDTMAAGLNDLPLSNWVAISGAALSTGLGRNTSLGLSLLAGLSNLRLGVWWPAPDAGRSLSLNPMYGVFPYLLKEFTARFAGVSGRRWYLTDGGHFENTAVYELVRRRVELIVCCDNGADPDYQFEDVVNLARKLRIDFGATLEFLPGSKLDELLGQGSPARGMFGELQELVRYSKDKGAHGPYAAIGRIMIPDRTNPDAPGYCGTLILLKPRLTGLEMVDLVDYHRVDESFPQQTTADQFFDEAQWESYFRLGATIADKVFGSAGDKRWSPMLLEPITERDVTAFCREWPFERPEKAGPEHEKGCCSCPPAAAAATPAAAGGGMGLGRMMLLVVVALGSAGIATGVGQSLTNAAVSSVTSVSQSAEDTQADNGMTNTVEGSGGDVTLSTNVDPQVVGALATITGQLETLIARLPRTTGGDLAPQLVAIRVSLENYLRSQDPEVLRRVLAQLTELRTQIARSDAVTAGKLDNIDASLRDLARGVREAAPRRNVRSTTP